MNPRNHLRAAAIAAALFVLSAALPVRALAWSGRSAFDAAGGVPGACRTRAASSCRACAVPCAGAVPQCPNAKAFVLLDASSSRVLAASHEHEPHLIASTTKIMTALLICESGDLDEIIEITPEMTGVEGSSLYLKSGDTISRRALLYGLMLHSGNDAAVALALSHSGSLTAFVEKMNQKADFLALSDTHFANPHGLDSVENHSSALDLAFLARHALQNSDFLRLVSTKTVTLDGRTFTNHNKLLWQYPGCIGVKTGYTRAAGRILVSAAERDDRRLIAVTISDPSDWTDAKALFDFGFSAFSNQKIIEKSEIVGKIPIIGGVNNYVNLIADKSFIYPLKEDEKPTFSLLAPHLLFAPCPSLSALLEIRLHDRCIGRIPLSLSQPVAELPFQKSIFQRLFGG